MLVCPRIAPVAAERRGWVLVCPEIRPIAAMRRGWVLVCPRIAPVAVAGPAARFPVLCCGRPGAPCLLSHGEQVYKIAGRGSSQSFRLLALILTWPHGEELGAVCPAAMSQPPSFVDKLALGQPRLRNRRLLWTNLPSASPDSATALIRGQPCPWPGLGSARFVRPDHPAEGTGDFGPRRTRSAPVSPDIATAGFCGQTCPRPAPASQPP